MEFADVYIYTNYSKNKPSVGLLSVLYKGRHVLEIATGLKIDKETAINIEDVIWQSNDHIVLTFLLTLLDEMTMPLNIKLYNVNKKSYVKNYTNKDLAILKQKVDALAFVRDSVIDDRSVDLVESKNKVLNGYIEEFIKMVDVYKQANKVVGKKYYLTVPFQEKDKVKNLGAIWDSKMKMWYISEKMYNKRKNAFLKWLIDM